MKMGIAFRFGLLLSLTGILASGLTGYYAYAASRGLLIKAAEERLLTATRVLSSQLMIGIENTARDARLLSGHPHAIAALRGPPGELRQAAEDDIAALFAEMLKTHPEYFQVRLIDALAYGIERVRIDRDVNRLLRIQGDDLQEKGHLPYVFESLQLPAGASYASSPVINHEIGAHAGENKPSLHLTAPVYSPDRRLLGLIVINVDLDNIFRQLAADLPPTLGLYLTNHHGDFLLHPDSSQAFAFDQGRRIQVQHQFPATAA
jgi:diguanylate cyclase